MYTFNNKYGNHCHERRKISECMIYGGNKQSTTTLKQ